MQRLPRLELEQVAWRLPLTDSTAGNLLGLVSSKWTDTSACGLESILVTDPVFTIWVAVRARYRENVTFGCHADAAKWLTRERLLGHLRWEDASDAAPLRADVDMLGAWRHLGESSVRLLSSNSPELAAHGDIAQDRAFYRRSLSLGAKFLGASCQRATYLDDGRFVDRVVDRLVDLGAAVLASDLRSSARGPVRIDDPEPVTDSSDSVGRWSNEQVVAPLLPAVTDRLRRLVTLEDDFSGALESAKLSSLRELAYGASHEINNPLANISARAQTLLADESDPGRRKKLAAINRQAFQAHEMIADMMLFAKPPPLRPQLVQIADIIESSVEGLRSRAMACKVRIEQEIGPSIPEIAADPIQLGVALRSILQNGIQAIQDDGTIRISASAGNLPPNHRAVTIRVQDSGPGIPEQTRLHIFDPFFSGREAGRGLGFGLSKAWRIVQQHGGRLDVENAEGGSGTIFTMCVPSQAG